MSIQIIIVLTLNFIISLIGTLAYSVRLVGVRTGKIALSFAVFNMLMLVSRTAATFQAPKLIKFIENTPSSSDVLSIFNYIIIISGIATIIGAFLIPTFQRLFYTAVLSFSNDRSISKLVIHSFSKIGVKHIKDCTAIPNKENLTKLDYKKLPVKILIYNTITVALLTVGTVAPIYAGIIAPELSGTCIALSSFINGGAAILMAIFVDPQLSMMTDDVLEGKCSEEDFRGCVIGMVGTKTIGTFLALLLVVPSAYFVAFIARVI
ncbi:MAG: lipid II flippase Amj family protein [Clostridiaceae bacterium]